MPWLAQLLGLQPQPANHIGAPAARAAALAYLRADGADPKAEGPGSLTWDASGHAVWRFRWDGPLPGAPDLVVDVDASTGAVRGAAAPPR